MNEQIEPKFAGSSAESAVVAERFDELAARASGLEPHFERAFTTRLFKLDNGELLSVTELEDHFHSMRVALVLDDAGTVVEAAGRMRRHPYDTCPRALESLQALVGLGLRGRGAASAARHAFPRSEGCLHVLDMIQVAVRSLHIAKGKDVPYEGEEGRRRLLRMLPNLRDTCVSYAIER